LRNAFSTYRFSVSTILPLPIVYGVWHTGAGGGGLFGQGVSQKRVYSEKDFPTPNLNG